MVFFLLHRMKEVPLTFNKISQKILTMVTSYNARTIIIVFDRYFTPSIKDNERALRGSSENSMYVISGDSGLQIFSESSEMHTLKKR